MSETTSAAGGPENWVGSFLNRSLGILAAVIIFLLMALTCVDVFGRYVLNAPIPGAAEIIEQMMGIVIFVALPVITYRRAHITIDLLDALTSRFAATVRDAAINLISAVALGGIAWRLWHVADEKILYGDVTEYLNIPLYPVVYLMAVMTGLTSAVLVAAILFPLFNSVTGHRR